VRVLTKSEFRLAVLLVAAVLLAVNLFLLQAWQRGRSGVLEAQSRARAEIAEAGSWTLAAGELEAASQWIRSNPAPDLQPQRAAEDLLQRVRTIADNSGLEIVQENLTTAGDESVRSSVGMQAKITGPFDGVARFLFDLQDPAAWRAIDKLMIKSDREPPNVVVDMLVRQYYSPTTPSAEDGNSP
jgi:uncharacterized membrane protein affecting hemolysin expression